MGLAGKGAGGCAAATALSTRTSAIASPKLFHSRLIMAVFLLLCILQFANCIIVLPTNLSSKRFLPVSFVMKPPFYNHLAR
jgi:hypothetical protein